MATNTINLISSVSNKYSTMFKVKLNGEDTILVGKQNFNFNKPYSNDVNNSFIEKHANFVKTFHSFPKTYFTDRVDENKKDVIIPSVDSTDIAQIGNKFIALNSLSNNPIIYNGYGTRLFGSYYYDYNNFIYGELDKDRLEKLVNYGVDLESYKNNILEFIKDNYYNDPTYSSNNIEETEESFGAALERRRKGYPIIKNVEGITLFSDPNLINASSTEAPTNSFYEIDENWIWNSTGKESVKPIYSNFSRLQNNLSPLSNPELTFENELEPQFKMWRKYNNIGINDSNNLWMSYNLELAKESNPEFDKWMNNSNYKEVNNKYGDDKDNFICDLNRTNNVFDSYSFFMSFAGFMLGINSPLVSLKYGDKPIFSLFNDPLNQIYIADNSEGLNVASNVYYSWVPNITGNYTNLLFENSINNINPIIPADNNSIYITNNLEYNYNNTNAGTYSNSGSNISIKTKTRLNVDKLFNSGQRISINLPNTEGTSNTTTITITSFDKDIKYESFGYDIDYTTSDQSLYTPNGTDIIGSKIVSGKINVKNNSENTLFFTRNITIDDKDISITINNISNLTFIFDDGTAINESTDGSATEFTAFTKNIKVDSSSIGLDGIVTDNNVEYICSNITAALTDETNNTYTYTGTYVNDNKDVISFEFTDSSIGDLLDYVSVDISDTHYFPESFYCHKLVSGSEFYYGIDAKTITDDVTSISFAYDNNKIFSFIPAISKNTDSFLDLFGAQFKISLSDDSATTTATWSYNNGKSYWLDNQIFYRIDSKQQNTLYCTIVGEGFTLDSLENIIDNIKNITFTSDGNLDNILELNQQNEINHIHYNYNAINDESYNKWNGFDTTETIKDDIRKVLEHNLYKRFCEFIDNYIVTDTQIEELETSKTADKVYATFIVSNTNTKPIEMYLVDEFNKLIHIHTFTTKSYVTKLELTINSTYKFKYSDDSAIGSTATKDKFDKIILEYYKSPGESFDFETVLEDYVVFKAKQINLTSVAKPLFDNPTTGQCILIQDVSNIQDSVEITVSDDNSNIYKLDYDETLSFGALDLSKVNVASTIYEGNIVYMYYAIFKSINIETLFDNYSLYFSNNLQINDIQTAEKPANITYKDSNDNIIQTTLSNTAEFNSESNTVESAFYEFIPDMALVKSSNYIVSGSIYGMYIEFNIPISSILSTEESSMDLYLDDNFIYSFDKKSDDTIVNIMFNTVGLNEPLSKNKFTLKLKNISITFSINSFCVYPLFSNYFLSDSSFTSYVETNDFNSIVESATVYYSDDNIYNINKTKLTQVRNVLRYYADVYLKSDNTDTESRLQNCYNTTSYPNKIIVYGTDYPTKYFIAEPKMSMVEQTELNSLCNNLNTGNINSYKLQTKFDFGGFSVYGSELRINDAEFKTYNSTKLNTVGFSFEFDDSAEQTQLITKAYVNGKIFKTIYTDYVEDTENAYNKYNDLNFGNLTLDFSKWPSKIHSIRSWNYTLDNSVFNMLHNTFINYNDCTEITNEIYEFQLYDVEEMLGNWIITDENVFNKTPINLLVNPVSVALEYSTTEEDLSKQDLTYKTVENLNEIDYETEVIGVRFSPWQASYNKFEVEYSYADDAVGTDNHRLFLIKDFDYIDRFAGLYRLDNGEGRASNLYSIKISNSGLATNNYDKNTQLEDYELQELMNTTCKTALENAIVSLTKKIQPINTQLFKVIYDDPGFTS